MLPLAAPCRPLPDTLRLHSVIDMVVTTLDVRDPYTFEHSYRVAGLAEMLAQAMHLSPEQCHLVHYAAHLHDIGKIGVSDKVLNKPGKLTAEEMAELQSHSLLGHAILGKIPELAGLAHNFATTMNDGMGPAIPTVYLARIFPWNHESSAWSTPSTQ